MKRSFKESVMLPLFLLSLLFLLPVSKAQESKEAPSLKTQEAVKELQRAPAVARERLERLIKRGKYKLKKALKSKTSAKDDLDLTLPRKMPERPEVPRYSPAGKRDPFRPLALKAKVRTRPRESLSPLERYELGQLKLVGIVWDIKEPRAMVEDGAGLGYIVKIGTPIGTNEGKVRVIKPTEILIEESTIDFYGVRKSRKVRMKLPTE